MSKITLLGIKRFKSKKGNEVCILSLSRPYTVEENDHGSYGCEIRTEFAPENQVNDFKADDIGKPVDIEYGFNDFGRPSIKKILVLK